MIEKFNFIINENDINKRIDIFLSSKIKNISRSYIQKLIENNKVLVNNKKIKQNYKLKIKDEIIVFNEIKEPLEIKGEDIDLNILYEDKDIIVINKKRGVVVHPGCGNYSKTIVNGLIYHFGKNLSTLNGPIRPGIVHRIDKDTSGIIVVAKNNVSHMLLAKQLEKHTMKRIYNAIVINNIKEDNITIDKPIGRHPINRKKMAVTYKNSKKAITHINVLERFKKYTLIKAKLETGRTHQIRVHMAYKGNPLLGDKLYGNKIQPFNLDGQVLHASVLGFIHPTNYKYIEFFSPFPDYFQNILNKLKLNN